MSALGGITRFRDNFAMPLSRRGRRRIPLDGSSSETCPKPRLRLLTSTGSSAPSLRRNITPKATGKRSRQLTESAIDEHDLAFHGTGCQKFDRSSRLNQWEGGLNQGIDLLCRKERENLGQILAQRPWVLPVQHRDAVEGAHATAQARANENIREHGQLGKFRGCSHETKADQDPAAPKRADATTGVGAADGVECVIDTRRFHATRKAINRTRAIVDGGGAERAQELMLGRRRGTVSLHSRQP